MTYDLYVQNDQNGHFLFCYRKSQLVNKLNRVWLMINDLYVQNDQK